VSGTTERDVANASGTSVAFVRRLVRAGILKRTRTGDFAPDAGAIARACHTLDEAGFGPTLVAEAMADGHLSLGFLGQWFGPVTDPSQPSTAFGLPEPDGRAPLPPGEQELLVQFLDIWRGLSPHDDPPVRAARILGESMRRAVEAFLDRWDEVAREDWRQGGAPAVSAPGGQLSVRMASLLPDLLAWLQRRHAQASIEGRIVRSFEEDLERRGRMPARTRSLPAIAFVDLSGFTRLTDELGDDVAVRSALELQDLASQNAQRHEGRLVKLLGDGVMLRFQSAAGAVRGVSELLVRIRAADLPAGHAGVASGPVVDRDGDVFGRTVNLAARLAGAAGPGELVATREVVDEIGPDAGSFAPMGEASLKGFDKPIALWRYERHEPEATNDH
jgi:class 3 adenylate cyclase